MTNEQPQPIDRPITLLLIDDDPIFRLGLQAALEGYTDLQIVAQANIATATQEPLIEPLPRLIILDPGLGLSSVQLAVLQLWQQLKSRYPEAPLLLLSAHPFPQQPDLNSFGIKGYCSKGTAIDELVAAIRQVAAGETYWQVPATSLKQLPPRRRRKWLARMGHSGLKQIDDNLAEVERYLQNSQLPLFDWLFWSGRKRELLSARWLVSQLPVEGAVLNSPPKASTAIVPSRLPVRVNQSSSVAPLFESTLFQIQSRTKNLTGIPFEIDLLEQQRKQELLYLVLNQVEKILEELRFLQVTPEQLPERVPLILRDLWQASTIELLSRYTSAEVNRLNLTDILMREAVFVQRETLDKIPFVAELFSYLLFEKPLEISNVFRSVETPETLEPEILLQNLIVHAANAVMQTILNSFYGVEEIKRNLYSDRFISSREMARFRNNLSWRYRQDKYVEEPKNIFESKYRLFYLSGSGIRKFYVYAPRQAELSQLSGISWGLTIALEARDAIAPRLQAVVDFVGRGVVYVLTEVIGKGLGLIGRGVILGIGNVLQETRYRKNSERGKQ